MLAQKLKGILVESQEVAHQYVTANSEELYLY